MNRYHPVVVALCRREGWEEPAAEVQLIPGRKFRCDLVWHEARMVVEVNGGVFVGGRHSRGVGQVKDMEKLNLLQLLGWRVLQVTPKDVTNGKLQAWLARAFQEGV